MTPNQINAAIAECLGWTKCNCEPGCKVWDAPDLDSSRFGAPSFSTDWNARPEMLKALSEDEKKNLLGILMNLPPHDENKFIRILELSQPQFAELFLRVKGKI